MQLSSESVRSGGGNAPYVSVVVTARNDDHGGNLLGRMQVFVDAWINQAKRHRLESELILVEWNPPEDRERLGKALRWPSDAGPCRIRIVEVPAEVHRRYQHAAALPLYQMLAKNVGIRRARGEFILATNIDIVFSDELVEFLASRRLEKGKLYRIDRHDVDSGVPVDGTLDEQLAYCRKHVIRLCGREGVFQLTEDGLRKNEAEDITPAGPDIHFGEGWFSVDRWGPGRPAFRWIGNQAEILARVPSGGAVLGLELEPGPGISQNARSLEVLDENGAKVAEWQVAGRARLELVAPAAASGGVQTVRLRVAGGGRGLPNDLRILNYRVFLCERVDASRGTAKRAPYRAVLRESHALLARMLAGHRRTRGSAGLLLGNPITLWRAMRLLGSRGQDIFAGDVEFWPGEECHYLEHDGSEKYRWAGRNAELLVKSTSENIRLALLVEPGPGVAFRPFRLHVRNRRGEEFGVAQVDGVSYAEFAMRVEPGRINALVLEAEGGGLEAGKDARILNFRIFACGAVKSGAETPTSTKLCATAESWLAITRESHPAEGHWHDLPDEELRQIDEMGTPEYLHTNACGDFTLMSRQDWEAVRGYAELDLFSIHLDSLLCYAAHYAGAREHALRDPMRVYHIEHAVGSGWTPEGQAQLSARIAQRGIRALSNEDVSWMVTTMRRRRAPLLSNLEDWGLPEIELQESAPAAVGQLWGAMG